MFDDLQRARKGFRVYVEKTVFELRLTLGVGDTVV